jgi:N-sulfoglucosamine sulfohydrolase
MQMMNGNFVSMRHSPRRDGFSIVSRWQWGMCALGMLASFAVASLSAAERPNILLIISEDNGPELGCYGEPYVKTPHLDQLAASGVRFDRAYVPQAGCSQSRAAYLTGLYPHQNGQIGLATWKFRMYDENTPNIVRSLKQAGYRTGIIGKLHVNPASAFPFDFQKIPSSNFGRKKLKDYAGEAKKFITQSDKPFFLSVNYPDPHRPFTKRAGGLPKQPLTAADVEPFAYFGKGIDTPDLREQVANYYNCMSRLDSLIGDLLKELRASGKYDNTLIVYFGDHGADLLRGKRTSYEGGVRIPLMVRWADRWQSVRNELVSTLDLMPTLLEVAGAKPVSNLAGRSLVPLLDGKSATWRSHLFTEFHIHSAHNYFPQRTVRNDRFKLIRNLIPNEVNPGYDFAVNRFFPGLGKVIAAAPHPVSTAYALMRQPPEFELYDLQQDPFEFRNLAEDSEHGKTLIALQQKLTAWRRETNDPLLNPQNTLRLKQEIEACFKGGKPEKARLELTYPDYFFNR